MAPSSAIAEHYKKVSVLDACSRANIPHGSALAEQLQKEAVLVDGPNNATYVQAASGQSLDTRIKELQRETKYSADLPADAPNIPASDENGIRANFDAIASGAVKVTG